jgi:Ca2+-binding RTX toxin-like protein
MPTVYSGTFSATQVNALFQGFTVLSQRLSEAGQAAQLPATGGDLGAAVTSALQAQMVGLQQPLATMTDPGQVLLEGLAQPLQALAVGAAQTADQVAALIQSAAAAVGSLSLASVTHTLETLADGRQIVWFEIPLSASTTLVDYTLDVGQTPSEDPAAPSLADQGLRMDALEVDVDAGLSSTLRVGIDLSPGLSTDEAVVFDIDGVRVCAEAAASVPDVQASFGVLDLGPASVSVAMDLCVELDLIEASAGFLQLGALNSLAIDELFSFSLPHGGDSTPDFTVDIPFTLGIGGFDQSSGTGLTLSLSALDGFDLGSLDFDFPELTVDGVAFDFEHLGEISLNDLGAWLSGVGDWLPQFGDGLALPLVDLDLGQVLDLGADWQDLIDDLRDEHGAWQFTGIHDLFSRIASHFGLPSTPTDLQATFALTWDRVAQALEWTLPYSASLSESVAFDTAGLLPEDLPLNIQAEASATVTAALDFSITGGVAISSSAQVNPVENATLLTAINSGVGLTTSGLLEDEDTSTDDADDADLLFTFADGSSLGVDLNTITGLGSTATVGDLLARLEAAAAGKLSAAIDSSRLVLTDLTTGSGTFSVAAASVTLTTTSDGTSIGSTSIAPLVLGLWGVAAQTNGAGQPQITGHSLESLSLADRLYIKEQDASDPLLSGSITIDATLEGGAAIGPVSLSIVDGQAHGVAGWELTLNDPATGADDGRIYLSELADADLGTVLDHGFDPAPTLDGIFQLAVTPDALNAAFDVDAGDYSTDPLNLDSANPDVAPDTTLVPYLDLSGGLVDGQWGFSVAPSEKLEDILSGGFADFSWDDLPGMLTMLLEELEGSALWGLEIPLAGVTLGDLFQLGEIVAEFALPDLAVELADLGTWKLDFQTDLDAALPELQALDLALPTLDLDLAGRLQQIQWEFNRIHLAWEGRSGGDADFDVDFMARLGAWSAQLGVFLGDLDLAFDTQYPGGAGLPGDLGTLNLTLDGLVDWVTDIPFGLDGLALLLEGLFLESDGTTPKIPGLTLNVDLPTVQFGGSAPQLVFDLAFTLDPATFTHDIDLSGMDLGGGSVLDITSEGAISLALGGSFETRIGFDFGTMQPIFDLADTSAALTLGIVTTGPAQLGASLGGLAGVSIGKVDGTINDPFSITLTETDPTAAPSGYDPATDPATITFDGALAEGSRFGGAAHFRADLPLYVDALGSSTDVGDLVITADFNANPLSFDADIDASGVDLEEAFSLGDLDLSGWLDGALAFVDGLITVLESDLIGGLPVIADLDLAAEGGFLKELRDVLTTLTGLDQLGEIYLALDTAFDTIADTPALADALSGSFSFKIGDITLNSADIGVAGSAHHDYWNTDIGELFTGAAFSDENFENLVVEFNVGGLFQDTLDGSDLDLGLDDLGVALDTTGGVDLVADFDLRVGFGYSPTAGFFVQGTSDASGKELEASVGVGFSPGSAIGLDIGPLNFTLTDKTDGEIVEGDGVTEAQAIANRELHAEIGVDLGSGTLASTGGGLLSGTGVTVTGSAKAKLDLDLASNLGVGLELTTGYYDASADDGAVDLSWSSSDGLSIGDGDFHFEITDTYIDLGKLLGPAFTEMVQRIDEALEPLDPIVELLTGEVPLISDVSKQVGGGPVTVLDAIGWFGEGTQSAVEFIEFVDTVLTVTDSMADSGKFYLGGLLAPASTAPSGLGSVLSGGSAHTNGSVPSDDVPTADGPSSSDASIFDNSLGLSFPLLQDPGTQLFNFLFGGEADLVVWDIPDLDAGFDFRQSFPVFPPLYVSLFGGVDFKTNFDLGYDTRGLRLAMAEGGSATDLLLGVYLLDEGREDLELGSDDPEMSVTAEIGAGAELNVVVAQAGVDGGLRGTLGADLSDPDPDGKVYVDELAYNLMRGPQCIFDLQGSLDVFLEAYIKVGIDTPFGFVTLFKDRFKLAEATILDWSMVVCPPVEPNLADLSGTTLTLNMGALAVNVVPGETADGDETFVIDHVAERLDADGNVIATNQIRVSAYNFEEYFPAGSVTKIVFDAGIGNDTVLIAPLSQAAKGLGVGFSVEGRGGEGDDNLVGGSGANRLWGDAGSDVLAGRGGADTLEGGSGDDFLYGYGGADSIVGGSGDDRLHGEDDVGDLADFIAANPDYDAGSAGNDILWGGDSIPSSTADGDDLIVAGSGDDRVDAGSGDDAISAGAGDDTVQGGEGNDQIQGGDGNDKLWGDDSAGLIDGGSDTVHADKIEGGAGYNEIDGGTGNDLLYAVDEEPLATAAQPVLVGGWASKVSGGDGADMIYGTAGKDSLSGGFDSDYIESGTGDDLLLGGAGSDALLAAGGNATVYGGHGNDVIDGGDGANWIEGGPGNDQIYARGGADTVYGGTTGLGYTYLLDDLARGVVDPLHGGFRSTLAEDSCGPEIFFYPEVYEGPTGPLKFRLFNDADRDGVQDATEALVPEDSEWQVLVVQADLSAEVYAGTVTGGDVTLEIPNGLPDGDYLVIVTEGATGWHPVSGDSVVATASLSGGVATVAPALAWYATADITGKVTWGNGDAEGQGADGATVFIDTDRDGKRDAGETSQAVGADGTYRFEDLSAGTYQIGVEYTAACTTAIPRAELVAHDGVSDSKAEFVLVENVGPVVSGVALGGNSKDGTWWDVADGSEQKQAVPATEPVTRIAIDLCSGVEVKDTDITAKLQIGKSGAELLLAVASSDTDRVVFTLPDGQNGLGPGEYRLIVDANSLTDSGRTPLDGNWIDFKQSWSSGDGVPGDDFAFTFFIGDTSGGSYTPAAATLSSTDEEATITLPGNGTGVLQGTVWVHDTREPGSPGRDANEAPLAGQYVEIRDASGQTVATVATGSVDLDGDGVISRPETAAFRIEGLGPGTYTATQVTASPWAQAVKTAPGNEQWLGVVTDPAGKSELVRIDASTTPPLVSARIPTPDPIDARDVTWLTPDTACLVGTEAGVPAAWIVTFRSSGGPIFDPLPALPSGIGAAALIGADALGDGRVLVTTAAGQLLRLDLASASSGWTEIKTLIDGAGQTLYPVGDVALVSATEGWLIAKTTAPKGGLPDREGSQLLVHFNPETGGLLGAPVPLLMPGVSQPVTPPLLIGLDWHDGKLSALSEFGKLHTIDPASGSTSAAADVDGLQPQGQSTWLGGLSVQGAQPTSVYDTGSVTVQVGSGQTQDIGFGNVPERREWLDGDDTIDGGCGPEGDVLHGDDYLGTNPALQLPPNLLLVGGNDQIRGRDGNDTIDGGLQGDTLQGEAGDDRLTGGRTETNRLEGGEGHDTLTGGVAADYILAGDGDDSVDAGGGADLVFGEAGADTLNGGDGQDVLVGGAGSDTVRGDAGDDTLVVVNGALGDAYQAAPADSVGGSYDGGAEVDQIVVVRSHEGSRADIALTDAAVTLDGATAETVTSVEGALLAGGAAGDQIDASGFSRSTVIRGNGGNDTLTGGSGNDLIEGHAGNDGIAGGAGNDTLRGGADQDTVDGGEGGDAIEGGAGSNVLTGGAGDDRYTLAASSGNTVNETAGGGNDTVDGSATTASLSMTVDANSVYVWSGASLTVNGPVESLILGSGDDYVEILPTAGSTLAIDAGPGEDTLTYAKDGATWSTAVTVDLDAGSASGLYPMGVTGFENVHGGQGDDTLKGDDGPNQLRGGDGKDVIDGRGGPDLLYGEAGNDSLLGGDGNDLLDAGSGVNTLKGGAGDDVYAFVANAQTDQVTELAAQGSDHLNFGYVTTDALTFALKASGVLEVSGAGLSVQAHALSALDSVIGGDRADRFVFDDGASIAGILDGGGVQSLDLADQNTLDYSAYTTPVTVDLSGMLSASSISPATGTAGVKGMRHVIGGGAADTLTGGGGVDLWLEGGAGADRLSGSAGWDLLAGGSGNDTLYGHEGQDRLEGGADDDRLYGGAENDTLIGGAGDDLLDGGAGSADEARFSGNRADYAISLSDSVFLLTSAADGTDKVLNIEHFVFADESVSATVLASEIGSPGIDLRATAYSWKSHTLLAGTSVALGTGAPQTAGADGTTTFNGVAPGPVSLKPVLGTTAADGAAVTLTDAVAILKMIAGAPVNPPGQALSPYQSIAADADGNGTVSLADALGVLRHAVGLPAAATPKWVFVDEGDLGMPACAGTSPGAVAATVSAPAAAHVGLVGILRGDVDGSWTPPLGAKDLDDTDANYFTDLAARLNTESGTTDFNPSQWGVYSP